MTQLTIIVNNVMWHLAPLFLGPKVVSMCPQVKGVVASPLLAPLWISSYLPPKQALLLVKGGANRGPTVSKQTGPVCATYRLRAPCLLFNIAFEFFVMHRRQVTKMVVFMKMLLFWMPGYYMKQDSLPVEIISLDRDVSIRRIP